MKKLFAVFLFMVLCSVGIVFAQSAKENPPPGLYPPGTYPPGTYQPYINEAIISQILSNPVYDQVVRVKGVVVRHVRENDYLLDDGTGQIIIDGGPIRHHTLVLPLGEEVTVIGEVCMETPFRSHSYPEIDIYKVILSSGKEIVVRGLGRPPWAGGPKNRGR